MKRYAFATLWLALLGQALWMIGASIAAHALGDKVLDDSVSVIGFAAFAATGGRVRWLAAALRVLIALAFLASVADRFGLLGPPGASGVGWGDFAHFIAYTRTVNAFVPASWAPTLAGLATLGEATLGMALLLGVRLRLAALGSAALLLLYGTAMTLSLRIGAQFAYAVCVLFAGAWSLAASDASALSLDGHTARRALRAVHP